MEVKLWNELSDQEAEKVSGGEGIGDIVSGLNESAKEIGFKNSNEAARTIFGVNYGTLVSDLAQVVN